MNKTEGKNLRVVLYEGPGSAPMAADDRYRAVSSLLENGFEVSRPAPGGAVAPADGAPLLLLGLFDEGHAPAFGGAGELHVRDVRGLASDAVLGAAREVREASGARRLDAWKPWFPVIDYDRCTNCMQCLTFCLFEVYGVDKNDKITVQTQSNCKTDCPACSRVCPEVAILFPKYKKGPINGDVVKAEDVKREAMKIDISALLGGDLYASLRDRQHAARERFSTERDESKALLERKRCLKELGKDLDIPDEVLMSLPSVGDIQERAERARSKLATRQARSQTVKDTKPGPTEREWGI
ncbi:MAG TPA: ferredoxin family protein [Planctomycetota bacterium]|nr:ferredoxin family protein [Planctomycetota bacterium]